MFNKITKEILMKVLEDITEDLKNGKFEEEDNEDCDCIVCATYKDILDVIDSNAAEEWNNEGEGIKATRLFLSDFKHDKGKMLEIHEGALQDIKECQDDLKMIVKQIMASEMIIDVLTEWGFGDD